MAKLISRTNAEVLIDPQISAEIFQQVVESSSALKVMKRLPNMTSNETKMKVLDSLPSAYWVDGDTGLKNTTDVAWRGKTITAEEIAVIVPLPEAVVNDASIDLMAQVRPLVQQEFARVIDNAMLSGIDVPKSWDGGLVEVARNSGNIVKLSSSTDYNDFFAKVNGEGGVLSKIEANGFMANGIVAGISVKSKLRGATNKDGNPLPNVSTMDIDGIPITYVKNGTWDENQALLLAGDFTKAVYAIRQDLTMKIFTEGSITDSNGKVIYNLMQNDMVALRFTMRLGWAYVNPVTVMNEDEISRFPFAILQKNADPTLKTVTFTVSSDDGTTKVADAVVSLSGMRKKTDTDGVAAIASVDGFKAGTRYTAKKGDAVKTGSFASDVTEDTAVAINNLA